MAAFFLLLAILVGVVLGDALFENDGTGALTLFGQSTERFNQGQLLLLFAGLGFLFALLLVLSRAFSRSRRTRRKELRTGRRELGDRVTELERDNARLQNDLAQRDDALAGREAELAHRDRQLALKDEELARREQGQVDAQELARREEELARREQELGRREEELRRAGTDHATQAQGHTPAPTEILDRPGTPRTAVLDQPGTPPTAVVDQAGTPPADVPGHTAPGPPEAIDRDVQAGVAAPDLIVSPEAEPVAPLHDEPPWQAKPAGDPPRPGEEATAERAGRGDERARSARVGSASDQATEEDRTQPVNKPDQNS